MIFVPTPNWSATVTHYYIPTASKLTDDADTFDGINGWEDYVVFDCLVKFVGGKEESDASVWADARGRALARVMRVAMHRDLAEPPKIRELEEEEAERLWPRYGTPP